MFAFEFDFFKFEFEYKCKQVLGWFKELLVLGDVIKILGQGNEEYFYFYGFDSGAGCLHRIK